MVITRTLTSFVSSRSSGCALAPMALSGRPHHSGKGLVRALCHRRLTNIGLKIPTSRCCLFVSVLYSVTDKASQRIIHASNGSFVISGPDVCGLACDAAFGVNCSARANTRRSVLSIPSVAPWPFASPPKVGC